MFPESVSFVLRNEGFSPPIAAFAFFFPSSSTFQQWPAACKLPEEGPSYCYCCWKCLWKYWCNSLSWSFFCFVDSFLLWKVPDPKAFRLFRMLRRSQGPFALGPPPCFSNPCFLPSFYCPPASLILTYSSAYKMGYQNSPYNTNLYHGEGVVLVISPICSEASFLLNQATVCDYAQPSHCPMWLWSEGFSNLRVSFQSPAAELKPAEAVPSSYGYRSLGPLSIKSRFTRKPPCQVAGGLRCWHVLHHMNWGISKYWTTRPGSVIQTLISPLAIPTVTWAILISLVKITDAKQAIS